jgi:very-short-patch-repair endonuclease
MQALIGDLHMTLSVQFVAGQAADVLHQVSANEISTVCDRLGLGPSDKEPFSSKRAYVRDRVNRTLQADLPAVVDRLVAEFGPNANAARSEGSSPPWLQAYDTLAMLAAPGGVQQIVFASRGKPDLVIDDVPSGRLKDSAARSLIWRTPVGPKGLTVGDLRRWWTDEYGGHGSLYRRLDASVGSEAERRLLEGYYKRFVPEHGGGGLAALLPQVWLHYDPLTRQQRLGRKALERQRLDFLMFAPQGRKILLEVDGPHHIADDDGRASLGRYAAQLAADRALVLQAFTIFRFGANELSPNRHQQVLHEFFLELTGGFGASSRLRPW